MGETVFFALMIAVFCGGVYGQDESEPVTPEASAEARALLGAIHWIAGRNTLSGQHNFLSDAAFHTQQTQSAAGRRPAIWGSDFGIAGRVGGLENRGTIIAAMTAKMMEEARRQFEEGAIVALSWRAEIPMRSVGAEPAGMMPGAKPKVPALGDEEWEELLTPGTSLHRQWEAQVDVIAGYLAGLRDARVPVLWRPYPELNGSAGWWSGRAGQTGSVALYRMLFERLAVYHRLDNLIWVWSAALPEPGSNTAPAADFYPGDDYCDILAASVRDNDYSIARYEAMTALAGGKPVALDEVDRAPAADLFRTQPKWAWVALAPDALSRANSPASIMGLFLDHRVVHAGNPLFSAGALRTPEPEPCVPVNPAATPEARELLAWLCSISGRNILSGQHNFPFNRSQHSDDTAAIAGKYPAVWGSDFGFTGGTDKDSIEGRDAMIEEAIRQHAAGSIITLMWHVVKPMDDEPVRPGIGWFGSVQARISDFEWDELITPGTELHRRWENYIDIAAKYLRRLEDAAIPVLWRPYHEMNGNWFWWGGRPGENGFIALYRMTYDRMVNHHKLDNLIWVWNPNAPTGNNVGAYA
ncbi:MAG TPA: glycosyl hydrolase, partial [Acidobacteriota bacterium]|nr:glycosyl hydrolase [Acidobacteriota bacterium]